ncbi:MAG TPA: M14 family metallopeptidase [Thermoanaerobaculia bacterium]|nr:M14 family metallopeptidase [Thermoanaerobaculia bacterium]
MTTARTLLFAFLVLATAAIHGQATAPAAPLPPPLPWDGKSRELIAKPGDRWITPAEQRGFRFSPSYDETVAWLKRLTAASPDLRMISIGKSHEGRDIWMVIASRDRAFTPEAMRQSRKPLLLAQAGIHGGEIDGKDAGMMLLRDMTVRGAARALLDRASFLFVPIFNVDGHERATPFGRINQRGPEIVGWRTNARNLNLNRDYTKLDSDEMRAMIAAIRQWNPDLYVDLHVTDGADYQYDITYGWNDTTNYSPWIVRWLAMSLEPALTSDLRAMGHIPGPFVFAVNWEDLQGGIELGYSPPRFSTGYGDLRHLPTVLVENHSLKPYQQRVLGTRVLLESMLATLGKAGTSLRVAVAEDSRRRLDPVPLEWGFPEPGAVPEEILDLPGVESRTTLSPISGSIRTEWLGTPAKVEVPVLRKTRVVASAARPKAYWIPAAWGDIAARLEMHGIAMTRIGEPREIDVEVYRLRDPKLAATPSEGRVRLTSGLTVERRTERLNAGSWRVSTDQPLGDLAAILLEPASPDSFLQWGFFQEILERTEYVENYVLEPLAETMMAADPELAAEFTTRVAKDAAFRSSAEQRLRFFYERTPYYDERWLLYPIARER